MNRWTLLLLWLVPFILWGQTDKVTFSQSGGAYDTPFALSLQCQHPENHIHYTLNGSTPTENSFLYASPISLSSRLQSPSDIYKIHVSPEDFTFFPDSIMKAIVVRAAVFNDNEVRISDVVTQTYVIHSLGCSIHDLPFVSISTDSLALFDHDTGIFIPGALFDPEDPILTGNYMQSGKEWERLVNVEYYNNLNEGFNQLAGLRTHGGAHSRYRQQKGLKIYAREEYGKKNFKYKIFNEIELDKFKRLVLKPFVAGWEPAGVQDWLANHIARQMNMDALAAQPVVLFLNGEYWGIYYLEEKGDERYIEGHYDIDPDDVNIIAAWGECENGTSDNFYHLYYSLMLADLTDSLQYQQFASQINIPNFIDYTIFELFSANFDWPINNVRCWQENNGPWQWFFYDGDCCFTDQDFDVYGNIMHTGETTQSTAEWSTLFFRKLFENESFKTAFIQRLNELDKTLLDYARTQPFLAQITQRISPEIDQQAYRFEIPQNRKQWEQNINLVDEFLANRQETFRQKTCDFFKLVFPDNNISIHCYPNPLVAGQKLKIIVTASNNCADRIALFDLNGKCWYNEFQYFTKGEHHLTLSPDLPAGCYVVKTGTESKKIIITGR